MLYLIDVAVVPVASIAYFDADYKPIYILATLPRAIMVQSC